MNHASDGELISFCLNRPPSHFIGDIDDGPHVVRISEDTMIKFGMGLSENEFLNHQRAYDLVDQTHVQIPRAHRFFTDDLGRGYIVMEHVEGNVIDPLDDPALIRRLSNVLNYLHTIKGTKPGSLGGGPCRGLLWPDDGDLRFESQGDLESWLNRRLSSEDGKVSLEDGDLVLCHLDITPRNIIWKPDGSICLVGWASAGFYPRLFEFWAQWVTEEEEGPFSKLLLNLMKPLPSDEKLQQWPLCQVWRNNSELFSHRKQNHVDNSQHMEQKETRVPILGPSISPYSAKLDKKTLSAGDKVDKDDLEHFSEKESRSPSTNMLMSLWAAALDVQQFVHSHPMTVAAAFGTLAILSVWARKRSSI